jgi:hypothetical protein
MAKARSLRILVDSGSCLRETRWIERRRDAQAAALETASGSADDPIGC